MNAEAGINACLALERLALETMRRAKSARDILDSPPDPVPRHRRNLVAYRIHALDQIAETMAEERDRLRRANSARGE